MTMFDGFPAPAEHPEISNGENGTGPDTDAWPSADAAAQPADPGLSDIRARDLPLGTQLFRSGLVSAGQIQEALVDGSRAGRRLGDILVERGWVTERDLARALATQSGLPFVDVDPAEVDPRAAQMIELETAHRAGALVVGFQNGIPVVAVADPTDQRELDGLRLTLGGRATFVVAEAGAIARSLAAHAEPAVAQTPTVDEPTFSLNQPPAEPIADLAARDADASSSDAVLPTFDLAPEPSHAHPAPHAEVVATPSRSQDGALPPWMLESSSSLAADAPADDVPTADFAPSTEAVSPWMQPAAVDEWPGDVAPAFEEPAPATSQPLETFGDVATVEARVAPIEHEVADFEPFGTPLATPAAPVPPADPAVPASNSLVIDAAATDVGFPVADLMFENGDGHSDGMVTTDDPVAIEEPTSTPHAVQVRLTNGDSVEGGEFDDRDAAYAHAEALVGKLVAATGWPRVGARYIRPETILSVDVVEL